MASKHKVIVCGDIHGRWWYLNKLINRHRPSIILQCGDYGWWPKAHGTRKLNVGKEEWVRGNILGPRDSDPDVPRRKITAKFNAYGVKNHDTRIYWCDGNHEDHEDLALRVATDDLEVTQNVFYQPRNSTITLPDGRVVLFMGGATSVNKLDLCRGIDWFPGEEITAKDLYNLPDRDVDIVISHTCPRSFVIPLHKKVKARINDPSRDILDYVLDRYQPDLWFFGHWHTYKYGTTKGCKWVCLSKAHSRFRWWQWLDK